MVVHICHVRSSIIRHIEISRPWPLVPEETQLTSICDIALGKFPALLFLYPYLCWEQEAMEPIPRSLESPSQGLPLTLGPKFCLPLLSPSFPFWKVECRQGPGQVRSHKACGSPEQSRAK